MRGFFGGGGVVLKLIGSTYKQNNWRFNEKVKGIVDVKSQLTVMVFKRYFVIGICSFIIKNQTEVELIGQSQVI